MLDRDSLTASDLMAKWSSEADQMRRRQALERGAEIIREFLTDFAKVQAQNEKEVLTLQEAAKASGYSGAHLARLVRSRRLRTLRRLGSRGPLTFRRSDLPQKPSPGHTETAGVHDLASRLYGGKEA